MAEQLYIESKLDASKLYEDIKKLKQQVENTDIRLKVKADTKEMTKLDQSGQYIRSLVNDVKKLEVENKKLIAWVNNMSALDHANQILNRFGEWAKASSLDIARLEETIKNLRASMKWMSQEETLQARQAIIWLQQELKNAKSNFKWYADEIEKASWRMSFFEKMSRSVQTGLLNTFGVFSIAWLVGRGIKDMINNIKEWIDIAISFESAFAWVRKTVKASEYQFMKFNEELKEMSTVIPSTYEDLARIAELGGQMGIPLEHLGKFTKTLSAIDVSTDLWLEQWALQLSRIANVLWMSFNDIDRLWSAIVDLGNNFVATESEISNFMQRISWAGRVVGLSVWDVAGIATATTAVGISAEKWGTSVNKMLMAIEDAVNTGGSKLKKFAELSWITAEEFSKWWKENAGQIFVQVVEWLNTAGSSATHYLKELAWGGVRLQETFLNLAKAGGLLREAIEAGNTAYIENIALWEEASKRYGTVESELQMLNNEIRLQKEILGKEAIPIMMWFKNAILWLYKAIADIIVWFKELSAEIKVLIGGGGVAWLIAIFYSFWPIVWTIWTVVTALWVALWFLGSQFRSVSPAVKEIEDNLRDVNKELAKNDEAIETLRDNYMKGAMSLEEYREELDKLLEKKDRLTQKQKEWAQALASETDLRRQVEDIERLLDNQEKSINRARENLDSLNEKFDEVKLAYASGAMALEEYNKQKEEFTQKINKEEIALANANQSYNEHLATVQGVLPWMKAMIKYTSDATKLLEIFNNMRLDGSANREEIRKNKIAREEEKNAILANIDAQIKKFQLLQKAVSFIALWPNALWGKLLAKGLGVDVKDLGVDKLLPFSKKLKKLNEELLAVRNSTYEWYKKQFEVADNKIVLEWVQVDIEGITNLEQARQVADIIAKWVEKAKVWSKEFDILKWKQKEVLALISELENIDEDKPYWWAWWGKEDALKRQIALLEIEAMRRIQLAKENLSNEESVAKEILNIQQRLTDEKKKLEEDYIWLAVDWAKKVIEKYEELRKKWTNAFKDLAKDVESTSSEIEKLLEKIKWLNEKLADLESKRVEDLGKRYVTIEKSLTELNKKIGELNVQLEVQTEDWQLVIETRDELQESIKDTKKNLEDYVREIDKIREKMDDLGKSKVDKLSERFAKISEEVIKLNDELQVYLQYDILTDADAKKKMELEKEVNDLLSEQALIRSHLNEEQLQRAEGMVGESETEKILREIAEKRQSYEQEIADYEDKLTEQQELLATFKQTELDMVEMYDWLVVESDWKKYSEMLRNLTEYKAERDKLLAEQAEIKQLLTAQEIQDALIHSRKTEATLIMEKYNLEKATLNQELEDYKSQLNEKLVALAKYYWDVAKLQKEFGKLGISFSEEDIARLKESSKNLSWMSADDKGYLQAQIGEQKNLVSEQQKAVKTLETLAKSIEKLTDKRLAWMWEDALRKLYAQIGQLKLTASGVNVGNRTTTNNSIVNNQSFNLASHLDANAIARRIRLSIKL